MTTNTQQIVKEVNFYGDPLLAIQETKTQKIFVAINYVLAGLGFKERGIEYQRNKMIEDKVICKGVQKFSYPSKQGTQDTYCIILNKLPLALAKIRITPTMQKNFPKLSEKLEHYQSECADILADAFLVEHPTSTPQAPVSSNPLLEQAMMSLQQSQQNLINCTMEQGYQLNNHEEQLESIQNCIQYDLLHADKMDEIQEEFQEMDSRISVIENTSRIVLCEADDRRFQGDEDTLSDDEFEAHNAADLPSKEFAKWANDTVHKVCRKMKVGAANGEIWKAAYKGLQLPNGKQIQHLSELIDETYVSFRYIFALRLVKTLHAK